MKNNLSRHNITATIAAIVGLGISVVIALQQYFLGKILDVGSLWRRNPMAALEVQETTIALYLFSLAVLLAFAAMAVHYGGRIADVMEAMAMKIKHMAANLKNDDAMRGQEIVGKAVLAISAAVARIDEANKKRSSDNKKIASVAYALAQEAKAMSLQVRGVEQEMALLVSMVQSSADHAVKAGAGLSNVQTMNAMIEDASAALKDLSEQARFLAMNARIAEWNNGDAGNTGNAEISMLAEDIKKLSDNAALKRVEWQEKAGRVENVTVSSAAAVYEAIHSVRALRKNAERIPALVEKQHMIISAMAALVAELRKNSVANIHDTKRATAFQDNVPSIVTPAENVRPLRAAFGGNR